MTTWQIHTTAGKRYKVAELQDQAKPGDSRAAVRLLEDECDRRGLNPDQHVIRGWDQRRGWIEHGGPQS